MSSTSEYTSYVALGFSALSLLLSYRFNLRSTKLSMLAEVFVQLFSDETRLNRYKVREQRAEFDKLKHDPNYSLPEQVEEAGRYVGSAYERIGFFVSHSKNLTDEFLRWQGDVILDMWEILGPWVTGPWRQKYIDAIRERKPDATPEMVVTAYTNYFEWLKDRAREREDKYFQ